MTPSQRAMCAARAKAEFEREAKERQRLSEGRGKKGPANSRDKAGDAFGVDNPRHYLRCGGNVLDSTLPTRKGR
jgi:hypothetical protein